MNRVRADTAWLLLDQASATAAGSARIKIVRARIGVPPPYETGFGVFSVSSQKKTKPGFLSS
jgi:hypothetical protein